MRMTLSFATLPEAVRPFFRHETRDPDISPELRSWMEAAVETLDHHPDLQNLRDQGVVPDAGGLDHIQILLCHPEDLGEIFEADESTLGLHLIDTPDCDPFGEESASAKAYRILIAWDPEMISGLLREWEEDGFYGPEDAAMSWIATIGHEIHHVILFAENGNFNTPNDLDVSQDELGHDLFDYSTGYGIRTMIVDGEAIEPEDAEDAHQLMEQMVEERGRKMCMALSPKISDFVRMLETFGAAPEPV